MKFVIVSPRQGDGGPIVLHALCKHLIDLGFDSKIYYSEYAFLDASPVVFWIKWSLQTPVHIIKTFLSKYKIFQNCFPGYSNVPVRGCKSKYLPRVRDDTIVVYPETIHGNFLHAKNVVRWLLFHHNYNDTVGAYEESDLFVCYREVFNDDTLNPEKLTVCTPYFDLDTYKQYNFGERNGTCYIVRKGKNRSDLPENFDGVVIDKLSEKDKVRVFNECKYCVSYDTQTAYSRIAALCGCISVVIPEPGKTVVDYRSLKDNHDGVAWGFSEDEINHAIQTRHKIYSRWSESNRNSRQSAREFVEICKNYFDIP